LSADSEVNIVTVNVDGSAACAASDTAVKNATVVTTPGNSRFISIS
jgi:hypothetical protein